MSELKKLHPKMLLKNHLKTNGSITNEEARVICGVNRYQAIRLIRKLVREGFLTQKGKGRLFAILFGRQRKRSLLCYCLIVVV
jgi:Fic family protein